MSNPRWLEWVQRLHSIAQAGLTYSENPYDVERYHLIQHLAAEILAEYTQADLTPALGMLEREQGYATPKLDGRGVVFQDGRILLVKELSDGGWTLPGGWVDVAEPPSKAVEREVFEESGYRVKAVRLLALYDRSLHGHPPHPFSIYKMYFACDLIGGQPADSHETAGARFFGEDEIPPLSVARTTEDEIHRMFALQRDPAHPTEFD